MELQVTYYWDVSPCAKNTSEIFCIYFRTDSTVLTWTQHCFGSSETPGAHTISAIYGSLEYEWQTAQMLPFLLQNYQYFHSAPKCVCQQYHNSHHSSRKLVCSLHGSNEQMAGSATKCRLQTLIKQFLFTTCQLLGFFESWSRCFRSWVVSFKP